MTSKQEFIVKGIASDMAKWLMEDRNRSLQVALGLIYKSKILEQLQNPATVLYSESFAYNYDLLNSELKSDKIFRRKFELSFTFHTKKASRFWKPFELKNPLKIIHDQYS